MPRKLRALKTRIGELSIGAEVYLRTGDTAIALESDPRAGWEILHLTDRAHLAALWQESGPAVLASWVSQHPGTRCYAWWLLESTEPRRRLGGTGTPLSVLNVAAAYRFGVPSDWFDKSFAEMYPGRGEPPDGLDPPVYESQAAYLDRLRLLTAAERRKLPPGAFDPVYLDRTHER